MKKILKYFGFGLLGLIIVGVSFVFYLSRGIDEGQQITLSPINLSSVQDGVYRGQFDFKRWSNTLEVTVVDHQITEIKIIDDVRFVKEGVSNELFQKIIDKQEVPDDLVSEATITSKAYIKAIENALRNE
jgi:uncharacterized protein with FMN-binding domain